MVIKVDKYLECVSNKSTRLTKDILISLIKFSPNFTYNKDTDTIELKTKPLKNILTMNVNQKFYFGKTNRLVVVSDILKELIAFDDKSIISHNYVEPELNKSYEVSEELQVLRVVFDSESACLKIQSDLESQGLSVNVESENFKEMVIQKNLNFNFNAKKENYNPRKLSDNTNPNEINHNKFNPPQNNNKTSFNSKNKFDVAENLNGQADRKPTNGSGYKGKRSYNKFDMPMTSYNGNVPLLSTNGQNHDINSTYKPTISTHYSFKELCSVGMLLHF